MAYYDLVKNFCIYLISQFPSAELYLLIISVLISELQIATNSVILAFPDSLVRSVRYSNIFYWINITYPLHRVVINRNIYHVRVPDSILYFSKFARFESHAFVHVKTIHCVFRVQLIVVLLRMYFLKGYFLYVFDRGHN